MTRTRPAPQTGATPVTGWGAAPNRRCALLADRRGRQGALKPHEAPGVDPVG
jgi:hypothetical protein